MFYIRINYIENKYLLPNTSNVMIKNSWKKQNKTKQNKKNSWNIVIHGLIILASCHSFISLLYQLLSELERELKSNSQF